ncbi:MAG: MoaD/ThiS family protein [Thermoplasmata archaeon]|uniref:MoaD/ThiS family protein n=1 Tax=Candidatus Sysuiplasma superficiale TaxID=2823368 RepID=A0A8J7YT95_9ARCH|nr:MoaD/ThiS family protein [Candidatus Sysuiplasma superficiale]MBX8644174.1 MoaD/ThiS family protein [Candidatus Sysuiplasma superficiale]
MGYRKRSSSGSGNDKLRVVLSSGLSEYTDGLTEIEIDHVPTVVILISTLDSRFPGISRRLLDDQGNIRRHVNIFVDAEEIRQRDGILTSLADAREVVILPSVAGG